MMNLEKSKLFIFDADGTLWSFRKKTSNRKRTLKDAKLSYGIISLLKKLKKNDKKCVVLSYQEGKNKNLLKKNLIKWLNHFKIAGYFDNVFISGKHKSRDINKLMAKENLRKNQCFFIGDRYKWDYLESKKSGIKCFLLDRVENKKFKVKLYNLNEIRYLI